MPSEASLSRLGVRPAMMPWLYAPILNQPMSSPMMTMMLGLFCALAQRVRIRRVIATTNPLISFGLFPGALIENLLSLSSCS